MRVLCVSCLCHLCVMCVSCARLNSNTLVHDFFSLFGLANGQTKTRDVEIAKFSDNTYKNIKTTLLKFVPEKADNKQLKAILSINW